MQQRRIRAVFMRGGTSKAVMFRRQDLPAERSGWDRIFLGALGSPDAEGRQLDGMGGGVSSLSKVCIVGPPTRSDADVDYTFGQVAVRQALVDYSGSCGNMSLAISREAAVAMNLAKDAEAARTRPSLPRIAMLTPPRAARLSNGREVVAAEADIGIRMISMGQPRRAVPATGALCLAVACRIPGSIAAELSAGADPAKPIRIAHAFGIVLVDAVVEPDATRRGGVHCQHATLYRTCRRLFEGAVLVRASA